MRNCHRMPLNNTNNILARATIQLVPKTLEIFISHIYAHYNATKMTSTYSGLKLDVLRQLTIDSEEGEEYPTCPTTISLSVAEAEEWVMRVKERSNWNLDRKSKKKGEPIVLAPQMYFLPQS